MTSPAPAGSLAIDVALAGPDAAQCPSHPPGALAPGRVAESGLAEAFAGRGLASGAGRAGWDQKLRQVPSMAPMAPSRSEISFKEDLGPSNRGMTPTVRILTGPIYQDLSRPSNV